MKLCNFLRGVSAGALAFAVFATQVRAQEQLPTIEVGKPKPQRAAPSQRTEGKPKTPSGPARPLQASDQTPQAPPQSPIAAVSQPPKEDNVTYRPENSFSATKTNTPIMETPASVQVVPRAVLEDQKVTTISQAANNVSGVIAPDASQPSTFGTYIRGFGTTNYYKDGVRFDQNSSNSTPNLADIDRVEILKGPASILFGHGDPGGLINLVSKQPLDKPYTAVETQIGSWSTKRTTIDTTGPLTQDKSLLYRVNAAWDDGNSFIDHARSRDYYFAPTLRWNIDEHTYAVFTGTWRKFVGQDGSTAEAFTGPGPNSSTPWWAFAWGTGGAPLTFLPRSQNLTQPWGRQSSDEGNAGVLFSHDLNEDWNIKQRFHAQLTSFTHFALFPSAYDNATPFEMTTAPELLVSSSTQSYFTSTELTGKVKTGFVDHTLFLGVDYQHFNDQGLVYGVPLGAMQTINPLFPALTLSPFQTYLLDPTQRVDYGFHETWFGVSFQDQIKLPYNVFILAAGRYDHLKIIDPTTNQVSTDAERVTPRFGLLWRPIEQVALYGSYLTNFGNLPVANRGAPLPPESAQQWEVGVKTELLDKKLTTTIAYYDLTKKNIAYADPTDPTGMRQLALGEARNRGVELDLAGEILPGWRVIGGYSYIASIITKDAHCDPNKYSDFLNGVAGQPSGCIVDNYSTYTLGVPLLLSIIGTEGKRLGGVPRNAGSLWTTYEFQSDSPLKGFKIGGGAVARDLTQGDNFNSFHLPGYAVVGLMASYTTQIYGRKTSFQINVDNLLDTRYVQVVSPSAFSLDNGRPRSFKGTMRVEF